MEIVWSHETLESYFRVVDYLLEKWSINEIERFESRFDALLNRLENHSEICPKSKLLNFRKCSIDENNSLIYHEVNGKNFPCYYYK